MILYGKPVVESRKNQIIDFFSNKNGVYIAILFFWNNEWSRVYVRNKQKFGESVGCEVRVFGQEKEYAYNEIVHVIHELNNDDRCLGTLIQLPLPEWLQPYQQVLCDEIDSTKDIDAMTTQMMGKIATGKGGVVYPAAVAATIELLKYYEIDNLRGKQVSILGQSNLIGKPMALYCIHQWAQVHSFGVDGNPKIMKEVCKKSDYIISATGVVGLVDKSFIKPTNLSAEDKVARQIVIDIGYGFTKEGKATGDVKFDDIEQLVGGITPVPGGIWPLCVCELFGNVMKLN